MSNLPPSAPDALLRLWMLAGAGMAGLHGWLAWQMRDWPDDLPGPQPLRAAEIAAFMAVLVIVPAAVVAWLRWRATRDRALAGLALCYAALLVWSFMARRSAFDGGAILAGAMIRLSIADAAIALAGVAVALRALRLR